MRVLLITSRYPLPPRRGNQIRLIQWLEALGDHECALVVPTGEGSRELAAGLHEHSDGLASKLAGLARSAATRLPLQEGWCSTSAARRCLREALHASSWDLAIVQMVRCGWALDLICREAPGLPTIFDAIDSMSLHFERSIADRGRLAGLAARLEARRCRAREIAMAARATMTVAVSPRDLEALSPPSGRGRVIPVAGRPPRPVDTPSVAAADRPLILLSGNLGYLPTRRGAMWFADQVWPEIRRRSPGCRWRLAGARPPRDIRKLASGPDVELFEDPERLEPHLAEATLSIAPMRTGSGVPMKVLEAWAARVAVVTTSQAAQGLGPEARAALAIADGREAWISALLGLLESHDRRAKLVEAGYRHWQRIYHPDTVRQALLKASTTAALTASMSGAQS